MRFIGASLSDDKAQRNFQKVLHLSQQTNPGSIYRVIEVTSDQNRLQQAGIVRLKKDRKNHAMIIGVMLLPQFQGLGLAYHAQQQLMTEAQNTNYCQSFTAYCHINNERAHRLYQRLDFHKVRQLIYNTQPSIQWQRGI